MSVANAFDLYLAHCDLIIATPLVLILAKLVCSFIRQLHLLDTMRKGNSMRAQEEEIFLNERGVKVTSARFTTPGQMYAMSGVTAVKRIEMHPKRFLPIALLVLGLIGLLKGADISYVPIIIMAIGVVWLCFQRTYYFVVLSTASGEQSTLKSKDFVWISRIIHALNESIVYRG